MSKAIPTITRLGKLAIFLCLVVLLFVGIFCFVGIWALDSRYQLIYGNLFGSFLIGLIGALCYCWGIKYGFIDYDGDGPPQYMDTPMDMLLFCSLGGLVALVFQSPQAEVLTPIQAFVLGATWPSVVNRVITGNSAAVKKSPVLPPPGPSSGPSGQGPNPTQPGPGSSTAPAQGTAGTAVTGNVVPPGGNIKIIDQPKGADA